MKRRTIKLVILLFLIGFNILGCDSKSYSENPPDSLVYYNTAESALLFQDSEKSDFWLISQFYVTQRNLEYCAVATSVIFLNALGIKPPPAPFLYPYEMFTQENIFSADVLEIVSPNTIVRQGLTLEQTANIIQQFGPRVDIYHANDTTTDDFRKLAIQVLSAKDKFVAVNYSRTALGQPGNGHFSPLAAYNSTDDRFLIMDVARFKLPPVWVKTEDLWQAMNTIDITSGKERGFLIVEYVNENETP